MTPERGVERLRGELLGEALEAARGVAGPERERLLAHAAGSLGHHLGWARGAAVAEEVASPLWRARAYAELAGCAPEGAPARRVRARLRREVRALAARGAPEAEVGPAQLDRVVERLAEAGDLPLAGRLCARFPADTRAMESLLAALLAAGRRSDALDAVLRAPTGPARDAALEAVAGAFAAHGERKAALAAAERIADPFAREAARLDALVELSGAEHDDEAAVATREVRNELSALYAMTLHLLRCLRHGDEEGARAFAAASARIAATAVHGGLRTAALARAARLQADTGDVDGALATARRISPGPERRAAVEYALWRLAPEGAEGPPAVRAILGWATDDDEREIAAGVVARALLERRDFAGVRRWLRRVRTPARRSPVLLGLGDALLEWRGDVAGARRALGAVLPEDRDDMTFRNLAIEQLRRGDEAGSAATLAGMAAGREWAAMSLAGLAARYGQAERLRGWARARLDDDLRVWALLGAASDLDDPLPWGPGDVRVFR